MAATPLPTVFFCIPKFTVKCLYYTGVDRCRPPASTSKKAGAGGGGRAQGTAATADAAAL